ncbi:MAG: hypothetical protein V4753_08330 [Pseudomonadota bacterium]
MKLINQPTLHPTRTMAAGGWTSLLGPIAAAIIAPWQPGLSEACGGEVGASLVAGGLTLAQGAVNLVAGYVVKERHNRPDVSL